MDPTVVPPNPNWATMFLAERARLREVLEPWLTADVEHVGSTAVAGLAAKPIIDMVAGVADLPSARDADTALATLGYTHRRHRPDARLYWRTDPDTGLDTHHLHLAVPGSPLWVERITFRDALRDDAVLVAEYAAWKAAHHTGAPESAYGTAKKTPFVARVLAAHGVPLLPDQQRLV